MYPVLKLLSDEKVRNSKEIRDQMTKLFKLTSEDLSETLPSGGSRFVNRVAWAEVYLKRAGLLESPNRGEYAISTVGKTVVNSGISKIDIKYLAQFPQFKVFRTTEVIEKKKVQVDEIHTPQERLDEAFEEINAELEKILIEKIKKVSPEFFEKLTLKILNKMGYGGDVAESIKHLGKSHDGGIDGLIKQDPLGLDNIYIQAKRFSDNSVGSKEIQAFVGALHSKKANKGVFITTSQFTSEAKDYVTKVGDKNIVLIDGSQLAGYMLKYNVGVSTDRQYEIKHLDSDYFEEE